MLQRIVARQIGQRLDVLLNPADRRMVRLQVVVFAGNEKAPLAGFGIQVRGKNVAEPFLDLVGMDHPVVGFQQVLRANVGPATHGDQQRQSQGKGNADLAASTHAHSFRKSCIAAGPRRR